MERPAGAFGSHRMPICDTQCIVVHQRAHLSFAIVILMIVLVNGRERKRQTDRDGNESVSRTYSIGCQLVAVAVVAAAAAVLSSTTSSPGQHGNNDTNIYRFLFAVSLLFLLNALTTLRVVSRSLALSVCLRVANVRLMKATYTAAIETNICSFSSLAIPSRLACLLAHLSGSQPNHSLGVVVSEVIVAEPKDRKSSFSQRERRRACPTPTRSPSTRCRTRKIADRIRYAPAVGNEERVSRGSRCRY